MIEALEKVSNFAVLTYVVSSMLVMGMSQRLRDVVAPLKNPRMVGVALAVNFIAAPLLALLMSRVIPLQPANADGLLLLSGAAGSLFISELAEVADGKLAYALAIMLLLKFCSVVIIPVGLAFSLPSGSADPWSIAKPLILAMMLPLALGFVLSARWAQESERVLPFMRKLSSLAFLLLLVLMVRPSGLFGTHEIERL